MTVHKKRVRLFKLLLELKSLDSTAFTSLMAEMKAVRS